MSFKSEEFSRTYGHRWGKGDRQPFSYTVTLVDVFVFEVMYSVP